MTEVTDIANEIIRKEIEEYIERPEEVERNVNTFSSRKKNLRFFLIRKYFILAIQCN